MRSIILALAMLLAVGGDVSAKKKHGVRFCGHGDGTSLHAETVEWLPAQWVQRARYSPMTIIEAQPAAFAFQRLRFQHCFTDYVDVTSFLVRFGEGGEWTRVWPPAPIMNLCRDGAL